MTMKNGFKNFYPTPENIALKLISGLEPPEDSNKIRILEPSAGKGDILDIIKDSRSRFNNLELYCIEKESDFQSILRDKDYKFLGSDFLSFTPDCTFDYIIMNPPFDQGAKHFLKAWDIASDTEIRCLLNASTIGNPCTEERKLVCKIIEDNNGTVEQLGSCFEFAERKTMVDVVMVTIKKEIKDEDIYSFEKLYDQEKQFSIDDINRNEVANNDVFENLEIRYNKVREGIKKLIQVKNEIEYYGKDVIDLDIFELLGKENGNSDKDTFNNCSNEIRKAAWDNIFKNTKIQNVLTEKVKKKINKVQDQQGSMAFTATNMENLYSDLFQNMGNIMNDCIIEAFDNLTKYHEENRVYKEGWKTNERWMVGQKFILPRCIDMSFAQYHDHVSLDYSHSNELRDLEKAFCFLEGKKLEEIKPICDIFHYKEVKKYGKWYDSEFLEFKCFKKGTMHFKFKNESLWSKFNQVACEGKNWLGM